MADLTDPAHWDTAIVRAAGRMFLLAALVDRPRHGYGMAGQIRELCEGCCDPSDGMVYSGIHDLEQMGLIVCRPEKVGGRRRNVCELTEQGRGALHTAAHAWARHLPALQRVVREAGVEPAAASREPGACCAPINVVFEGSEA